MPITFNSAGGFLNGTISSSNGDLFINTSGSIGQITIGNLRLTGSIIEELDSAGNVRIKKTFADDGTITQQNLSSSKVQSTTTINPISGVETMQSASSNENQINFIQNANTAVVVLSGSDPKFSIERKAGFNAWQSARRAQRNFFISASVKFAHGLSSDGDYYFSPADSAAGINDAVKFENNPPFFMISQSGDVVIRGGKLIAESYEVSSSVTNMQIQTNSGSTKFGDTMDDTHQFTGSVFITGSSLSMNGTDVVFPSGIISASIIKGPVTFQIEADSVKMLEMVEGSADTLKLGGVGGTDVDTRIETSGDSNTFFVNGGTNKIGIGRNDPDAKLDITGDLKVSTNITASGNISSSGTGSFTGGGIFGDRVGIGTTSPGYALEVVGSVSSSATLISKNINVAEKIVHTGDANTEIHFEGDKVTHTVGGLDMITLTEDTTDQIVFGDARTKFAGHITASGNISASGTIQSTGNISTNGSITATSADINGNVDIDGGTLTVGSKLQFTDGGVFTFGSGLADGRITWDTGYASLYGLAGNKLRLGSYNQQGVLTISSSHENTMVISGSGVGIGIAAPASLPVLLHISSDGSSTLPSFNSSTRFAVTQTANAGGYNGMTIVGGHTNGASLYKFGDKDNEQIGRFVYYHEHNRLDTFVNNSHAMSIDSSQRVGIGTTAPTKKLQVTGDISASGDLHIQGNITASAGNFSSHITSSGNISASGIITAEGLVISDDFSLTDDLTVGGHITASGNISSSGDIFANEITLTGASAGIRIEGDSGTELTSTGTAGAFNISSAHDLFLLAASNKQVRIGSNNTNDEIRLNKGHITASGNISSSGDLFVDDIAQVQHITASGNISASLTSTGSFGHIKIPDGSGGIHLGSSNDLQIYHNGSNSFIQDTGAGKLILDTNGTDVRITKTDSEFMAKFITDGAVELYHNHVKKFETTALGIDVTGNINASSHITASGNISSSGTSHILGGALETEGDITINSPASKLLFRGDDTNMNHEIESDGHLYITVDDDADDSNNFVQFRANGGGTLTNLMKIQDDGNVGIGTTAPTKELQVAGDISASGDIYGDELFSKGYGSGYQIHIDGNDGSGPQILFGTYNDSDNFMRFGAFGGRNAIDTKARDFHLFGTNTTTGFFFDESLGNFGIKTLVPSASLDVNGNLQVQSHITASGNISASVTSTGSFGRIEIADDATITDRLTVGGVANFSGTFVNIGGGFGSTGVSIASDGDIQTNGTLTTDGNISSSGKITGDDFEFNLPTDNGRKFKGLTNRGVRIEKESSGGWAMEYGFIGNTERDLGGLGALGGAGLTRFYIGGHYTAPIISIQSGSGNTNGMIIGDNIKETLPAATLHISGGLFLDGGGTAGGHITASGNISSSGTITMLTASIGGGIFTSASLAAGGGGGDGTTTNTLTAGTGVDFGNGSVGQTFNGSAAKTLNLDLTEVIASDANNRVLTTDGDGTLTGEAKLTFDGNDLTIAGEIAGVTNITSSGNISSSGTLISNEINTIGHITASGNYSGSADSTFRIGGKLIAGSKSFVINRPEGGKLEYGVLEGQQNDVFFRGELKGDNVIHLPKEWEWLVDENTITVQLTSIGKHQDLYIKEIKDNKIFIDINGIFKKKENIHCYHIIYGTRKDIELIRNYQ